MTKMSVDCARMQEKLISNYKHERRAAFYVSQTGRQRNGLKGSRQTRRQGDRETESEAERHSDSI